MAHPNVENIEKAYAAFAEGDIATIMGLWTDDIVWHTAGNNPLAGDHSGKDAVAAYLGGVVQVTGGTFRAELQNALGALGGVHHGFHVLLGAAHGFLEIDV